MNRVATAGNPTASVHPKTEKHFHVLSDASNIKTEEVFVDAPILMPTDHHMRPSQENAPKDVSVIELSSSSSSSGEYTDWEDDDDGEEVEKDGAGMVHSRDSKSAVRRSSSKRLRMTIAKEELPLGFLDPLPPAEEDELLPAPLTVAMPCSVTLGRSVVTPTKKVAKQFWKAGDFDEDPNSAYIAPSVAGMDHVRVHPKFLHSNATSHKWALGALAELLDNSLDEVCNGATYVSIDLIENKKDGSRMLLIEDNGGGMTPDKMRQCMSLGYSAKSKIANTIGQYGNGFKTSTMRLGADVIVFSRTRGKEGRRPTQSIGMLSYTFLRDTGKEDIMVPMVDYEKDKEWQTVFRSSSIDWSANLEAIIKWSPYSSEENLLQQFSSMKDQGTRVVIYNLWEDDQGELELDFDADRYDIQIRGVNRDEKKIEMAKQFPNSRHFLTYRHSLRSYASILYLRLPHNFKMILRGKDIEHHNIVNDMMLKQEVTYKPQSSPDVPKDPNMVAVVTIGFVKDAKGHIDVQGFNVYHKNRLIKPFWRVWNAAGSDGRGVLGVLEANFVEPAHDKQDFERTTILSRLESKLIQMQKTYWSTNCHRIGYAPRCNKKHLGREEKESSPDVPAPRHRTVYSPRSAPHKYVNDKPGKIDISSASSKLWKQKGLSSSRDNEINIATKFGGKEGSEEYKTINSSPVIDHVATRLQSEEMPANSDTRERIIEEFQPTTASKDENEGLKKRIQELEEELLREKDRSKSLNDELQEMRIKLDASDKEQEALIDIFSEERSRRTAEEENLRRKLREALNTIQELRDGKVTTVGIASSC